MAQLTSSLIVRLVDRVSQPARAVSRSLLSIRDAGEGAGRRPFGDRLAESIRRNDQALARSRGSLVDAAAGFYALRGAIASPVREAMRFESAMADVKKVVDFPTPEALGDLRDEIVALSKEVPISVNGLAAIAAAAGQAGIAGEDLTRFTETAAKVGVAFDISADQAGESMAKLMTGLGLNIDEVTLLTDSMNHLSNSQASSAAEILDVVRRVGAQGKQFGFTSTEVAAFGSAMIAAGAQSEVASTSFRNMGKALTMGDSATSRVRDGLEAIGLTSSDVAKRMQEDAVGTTLDVLERISKMPAEMQAALSNDIFGSEARALGPLLTNLDLIRDSLGLVDDASRYAGSSFKEFEVRAETFENALMLFNNRLSAMKIVIGEALLPSVNNLMDALAPIIEQVTQFAKAHPELIQNVLAATAAVVGFKIAIAGLNFIGLLGRGGALSLLALGFGTVGKASIRLKNAAAANLAYQASLKGMGGGGALGRLQKLRAAMTGMLFAIPGVSGLAGAATALGSALVGITAPMWGAIALGIAAVAVAATWLWRQWDKVSSIAKGLASRLREEIGPALQFTLEGIEKLHPGLRTLRELLGPLFDGLGERAAEALDAAKEAFSKFKGWIKGFFVRDVLGEDEKAAFRQKGYDFADAMINSVKERVNALVEWFEELPGRLIEAIGDINLGSFIKWPEPPAWFRQLNLGDPSAQARSVSRRNSRFDGARASGGPVRAGRAYLVGEEGPEIVTFGDHGFVHNASRTAQAIRNGAAITGGADRFAGGAAPAVGGGGVNVKIDGPLTGPITISAGEDPLAMVDQIGEALEARLAQSMRGLYADGV